MKARIAVLLLVVCCAADAQTVTPSITIGTHVLTLGMPETTVLEQLGTDLELYPIQHPGNGVTSGWIVSKKTGALKGELMGSVYFDASHHLWDAMRSWDVEDTSSKTLFYAINEATKSVESDGLTACHISTHDKSQTWTGPFGTGSIDSKEIMIDCGIKKITIDLTLSDVPRMVPTSISVEEELRGK